MPTITLSEDADMRSTLVALAAVAVMAGPAAAQDHEMDHGAKHTDPVTALQPVQQTYVDWVITAAEQSSEADYAYRPVATVRTLGQLYGHVANSNYQICSTIRGEANPNKVDFEGAGKAAMVAGLRASAAYCTEVAKYAAEHHHDPVDLFGMKGDMTWAVGFNAAHNAEHYGNIVTYLRMQGKVPPSSQGGM